jgi:hypothetical protein
MGGWLLIMTVHSLLTSLYSRYPRAPRVFLAELIASEFSAHGRHPKITLSLCAVFSKLESGPQGGDIQVTIHQVIAVCPSSLHPILTSHLHYDHDGRMVK